MDKSTPGLDQFIDQLIAEKFVGTTLGDEAHAQIKKELADRLNQYITLRTIETISLATPEVIPQLEALIKTSPTAEQVHAFIQERVSEPDVLVAQILSDFRSLYIGDAPKSTH